MRYRNGACLPTPAVSGRAANAADGLATVLGDPQLAERGEVRWLSDPVTHQETLRDRRVERDRWATIVTAGFYVVLGVYVAIAMTCALAARLASSMTLAIAARDADTTTRSRPQCGLLLVLPPLNLYLNAAVFSLFGRTVIASRMLSNAFFLIVVLLVVWFYRARFRSWGPLVPVAALAVASSIGSAISFPLWPGFALTLSALLMHLRSQEADDTVCGLSRVWVC